MKIWQLFSLIFVLLVSNTMGQIPEANYDETKVPHYRLPDPLVFQNHDKVRNTKDWELRRAEIIRLFETEVYGRVPEGELHPPSVEVIEHRGTTIGNRAVFRRQIALHFAKDDRKLTVNVLVYLPQNVKNPPVIVGYNFYGNHTIVEDRSVVLTEAWIPNSPEFGITENKATEQSRGKRSYRWPVDKMINQGLALATVYYGDVDPDRNDFTDGIHPFFYEDEQTRPEEEEWGAIAAWAWGLSQVADYLQTDEYLKDSKYILFGHSRLGKAALWAGALDQRFSIVLSNESGCGGAALFRRKYGETAALINANFPHWFNARFKSYNNHEEKLPVDQHMLIALMAPRPVYIASAEGDPWADPKGEYLGGYHAGPVYALYGKPVLTNRNPPPTNQPVHSAIGYHIRPGKHEVTDYDWEQFLKFISRHIPK